MQVPSLSSGCEIAQFFARYIGIDFMFFMTKDSKFNTMRLRFGLLVLTLCFSWQKIPNSIQCVCVLDCWYCLCVFSWQKIPNSIPCVCVLDCWYWLQAYATSPLFLDNLHFEQFVKSVSYKTRLKYLTNSSKWRLSKKGDEWHASGFDASR